MTSSILSSHTTLGVILGAHDWSAASLESSDAFANSARAIRDYVISDNGLALKTDDVLDLFDDERDASSQISVLARFLKRRLAEHEADGAPITDLFIYYTGHGAFHHANNEYFLLVRNSESGLEYTTGLQIRYLSDCLSLLAPFIRKFIVLDCCFAAAAGAIFQSVPADIARQAIETLPSRGTLLFCSSSPRVPSRIEPGEPYTQFTGALNAVLTEGSASPTSPLIFTFQDLRDLVWALLSTRYGNRAVRPALIAPDQTDGDLAEKPAIVNNAKGLHLRTQTPPNIRTGKLDWKTVVVFSIVWFAVAYAVILVPFLNFLNNLYSDWAVNQLVKSVVIAALVSSIVLPIRKYFKLSQEQCFLVGSLYAIGGTIFVFIARFLQSSTAGPLRDVLNYYSEGEPRFLFGSFAVAAFFGLGTRVSTPLIRFLVLATAIWLARYGLYFTLAYFPEAIKTIIILALALPFSLVTLLILAPSRQISWKIDLAVAIFPSVIYALETVFASNLGLHQDAFLLGSFDTIVTPIVFWIFVVPLVWTIPGLYIARPKLLDEMISYLRKNVG
jgi:hypothetical protein